MAGSPPTLTSFDWTDHDPYIVNLVNQAIAAGQVAGGGLPVVGDRAMPSMFCQWVSATSLTRCAAVGFYGVFAQASNGGHAVFKSASTWQGGVTVGTGGACAINAPAGVIAGDLMMAVVVLDTGTIDFSKIPAGWLPLGRVESTDMANGLDVALFAKFATSADVGVASYDWFDADPLGAGSHDYSGLMVRYENVGAPMVASPGVVSFNEGGKGTTRFQTNQLVGPYPSFGGGSAYFFFGLNGQNAQTSAPVMDGGTAVVEAVTAAGVAGWIDGVF